MVRFLLGLAGVYPERGVVLSPEGVVVEAWK